MILYISKDYYSRYHMSLPVIVNWESHKPLLHRENIHSPNDRYWLITPLITVLIREPSERDKGERERGDNTPRERAGTEPTEGRLFYPTIPTPKAKLPSPKADSPCWLCTANCKALLQRLKIISSLYFLTTLTTVIIHVSRLLFFCLIIKKYEYST